MKKLRLLLISSILSLSTTTYARIGETVEQCIQRYGNEYKTDKRNNSMTFCKGNLYITIYLSHGKDWKIICYKIIYTARNNSHFNHSDANRMLLDNSNNVEWNISGASTHGASYYYCDSMGFSAIYNYEGTTYLSIEKRYP